MYGTEDGDLYLSKDELNALLDKELGHGTDGRVIKFDNARLLKFYHKKLDTLRHKKQVQVPIVNDDSDVKIYNRDTMKFNNMRFDDMFTYYERESDEDFIKIRSAEAINKAKERQLKVKKTRLPQGAVYVDGRFVGCVLIAQKGLQIHKLMGLPLFLKKKILLKVLFNIRELLDNCIYHIDLDNSPYSTKTTFVNDKGIIEQVGHSHVLINPITLEPAIIDLDGKSTIYTNFKSDKLEQESLSSFVNLMLEFLLEIDLDEYETDDDLIYALESCGIKLEYIDAITKKEMSLDNIENFINDYDGKRGL